MFLRYNFGVQHEDCFSGVGILCRKKRPEDFVHWFCSPLFRVKATPCPSCFHFEDGGIMRTFLDTSRAVLVFCHCQQSWHQQKVALHKTRGIQYRGKKGSATRLEHLVY